MNEESKIIETKILYKYKSCKTSDGEKWTKDSIKQKYYYFSQINQLNDPFDCQLRLSFDGTDEEIKDYLSQHGNNTLTVDDFRRFSKRPELQQTYEKNIKKLQSMYHVFSLTDKDQDEVMWSLYADYFNGLTIGYRVVKYDSEPNHYCLQFSQLGTDQKRLALDTCVCYSESPKLHNIFLTKVEYGIDNNHYFSPIKDNESEYPYAIFHKKENWMNENEYRAFMLANDPNDEVKDLRIFYPDEALSELTFGYNMKKELKEEIFNMVNTVYKTKVQFFEAKPDYVSMTIIKEPYSPTK